jgi:hypothetical protein
LRERERRARPAFFMFFTSFEEERREEGGFGNLFFNPPRARVTQHAKGKKNNFFFKEAPSTSRHNSAHALVSNKMTSMSSMGSHSNKDRSKTASSATVTRLFQKSLRDLITGTFLLLEFGVGKIQRESPRLLSIELRAAPDGDPFLVSFLIVICLSSLRSLRTNGERTTH